MLDESDATLEEENSATEDQAEVDWQKRYTDTQAEYTRNQQALADERKVWEDEQALLARVQEKFPHLLAEEEEDIEDDDFEEEAEAEKAKPDPRVEWLVQQESDRQYERDLNSALGDREVPAKVKDWIKDRTRALGNNPAALKQAVAEFEEISNELAPKKKPKAPHVPRGGNAGTGVKDFSQMSRQEIDDWMVERARALEAQ